MDNRGMVAETKIEIKTSADALIEKRRRKYRRNSYYKNQLLQKRPHVKNRLLLNMVVTTRLMKSISQIELAERVGVSRQTISSIEVQRSVPAVDVALAIAEVLEVDVNELFMFR